MHLRTILFTLISLLTFTNAFTKEDHEIFRLQDEVSTVYGSNVTFYSLLDIKPSASQDEITKAWRRKSVRFHPDKAVPAMLSERARSSTASAKAAGKTPPAPQKVTSRERNKLHKEANENYQRMSVIIEILRGADRDRYDHFLRNGFPRWKGTGYYYERYRPGLGSVLVGLLIMFGGLAHYGALYLGWRRHRDFVERYVRHARKLAWGNEEGIPGLDSGNLPAFEAAANAGINQPFDNQDPADAAQEDSEPTPQPRNRKEKRAMEKDAKKKERITAATKGKIVKGAQNGKNAAGAGLDISAPVEAEAMAGPQGNKKRVVAENGKVLIVDSIGQVFLEENTAGGEKQTFLLDPDEIEPPTIFQTALFRLPIWAYNQTAGRILNKPSQLDEPLLDGHEVLENPEDNSRDVISKATALNQKAETKKRKAKTRERVDAALAARNGL